MTITYSAQRSGFEPGRTYRNPKHFQSAMPGDATEIAVVGDWPAVVAAYEALGVKVDVIGGEDEAKAASGEPAAKDEAKAPAKAEKPKAKAEE